MRLAHIRIVTFPAITGPRKEFNVSRPVTFPKPLLPGHEVLLMFCFYVGDG